MSRPHIAELSVKDLALVSELRLELAPGLTVLTGETGAGKSMLVDALLAATGGRGAAGKVRDGAERAKVEAVFAGVGDDELILAREIQPGRSPARLNGETVPLAKLAETGATLVAIHRQGEQLPLARTAGQRDLLDAYAGHDRLRDAVRSAHRALHHIRAERASLGGDPRERARRLALLEHEVTEIDDARIGPDEQNALAVARSAQVAAYADAHVKVRKDVRGGRTHVIAERLAAKDGVAELADILGAGGSSKSLAAGARELQSGAADWRAGHPRPASLR
jgi:DNA repair protein RecN (Recombination protein N)